MPTPMYLPSLGLNMKYIKKKSGEGGLGEGRSASPESLMKAPLLTCNVAVSFQEKVRSQKSQPFSPNYCNLGLDKKAGEGIGGRA